MQFSAYIIEEPRPEEREGLVNRLARYGNRPALVLNTCQRLEVFGFEDPSFESFDVSERWNMREAFVRLVRIATGLESRILGELEVMGQVRSAYKEFQILSAGNEPQLDRIYQDVISLARKARRESGIDAKQTSLSGLACRDLLDRLSTDAPIAVIGSGSLATSVIRYLTKRGSSPLRVSSRCPDKAIQLAIQAGGFGASLDDLSNLLEGAGGIVAATAAPHPVLFAHHLDQTDHPLHVVDLGVPPDCSDCLISHERVLYRGLKDIEVQAQGNIEDRRARARVAEEIIRQGTEAWCLQH